ncbi:NADP-dependent oxidoreductase [Cupriavidus sp.]|jgi:NADPH-dependent curcumin reductase|uniref:NADP-dependent oxidoreductase n=1 Tax=Cupriavidus sp. TaxID=1873897 RepID=UPI0025C0DE34|nr:NADP-dependent oxidoreductase [Cupriavidus sp.]MCA3189329.1 NADP-dependent oxidoreductase [Cupriavidus sp.]MCA3195409.1 NADP-dependent oxidoreductase [Cupriavidus sp.]MCA3200964.1 NADP-dependent oxidoreductase [Cupriavidus sp.]MCA3208337.1 NADP-dependent oxidoreductase [Cupriavidus sp.]MCA3235951.1 NADP-dependent oxidoreductase [Cupriavidus sp.]
MSKQTYKRIVLASRPTAAVTPDNFRLEEVPVPELADGQVMVRNHFLSLDPYMRGRMGEGKSYADPQPLDEVMIGGTVGEVIASKNPKWNVGDKVVGMFGWQEIGVSDGGMMQKVDTAHIPLSAYLGSVGMPGVTAWYGLNKIIAPKAGETIVVSAASGAVGSVVGQLAKLAGCYVVGVAGGKDKCDYVTNELGFDACVDYKAAKDAKELYAMVKAVTPKGVDGYFENVGGDILDVVLARLNPFARIAVCGLIAGYDGQDMPIRNPRAILVSRCKIEGFIVSEHMDVWPQALKELGGFVAQGKIKFRESVAEGLASAPEAFIGLLKGKNFGKQLVKLA